jgi:peptide/nickel transport system substrate-binding protein
MIENSLLSQLAKKLAIGQEKTMKSGLLTKFSASLAAVAIALSMAGCSSAEQAPTQTLNVGQLIDIRSWDPSQADIGHLIPLYQGVYDNLVTRTPEGDYKPNLATDWSWNEDNTVLTMNLRTDVSFTDGAKFDAEAAKANLDNFINGNGPYAITLAGVSVAVVDSDTIELTLAEANPDFIYFLATTGSFMASPAALGTEALATTPVGSGPYILSPSSVPGSSIIFQANPGYWDKSKQKWGIINMVILPDVTARLNALASGQVDVTVLDVQSAPTAESAGKTLQTNFVDWSGLLIFDHNGQLGSPLGDVKVRQAMAYALDREAMLAAIQQGYGEITNQVYGTGASAYLAELDNYYSYDPAKSKELLAEAGYPNGGVKITLPGGLIPPLDAVLVDYLGAVGFDVTIESVPPSEYRNKMREGAYAAGWFQLFQGTSWVNTQLVATPSASWNVLKSTSPVIDAAVASVKADGSDANVAAQTQIINKFLVENAWSIPFYRVPQMLFYDQSKVKVTNQVQNAVPYLYNYAPVN